MRGRTDPYPGSDSEEQILIGSSQHGDKERGASGQDCRKMNLGIDEIAIKTQTVRVGEISLFALK